MQQNKYNYLGQNINDKRILLIDSQYGYVDESNIPHINWGNEDDICDIDGFDKTKCVDGNIYKITDYIIPKGTYICRYGFPGGLFTTLKGTPYELLGLPYIKDTIEYHEYKVTEDLKVDCIVTKGIVAPKFNSDGGAIQFFHRQTIAEECEDGILEEVFEWIQQCI